VGRLSIEIHETLDIRQFIDQPGSDEQHPRGDPLPAFERYGKTLVTALHRRDGGAAQLDRFIAGKLLTD
jgi:hypothetical protein